MANLHEVVVSGIAGRFPDCYNVDDFMNKLFASSNLQKIDTSLWNARVSESPFATGKIPDWNRFDTTFFGISNKLVHSCDPQLGKCLETGFEAFVDAGVNPYALAGRNIGVVSTSSLSDAEALRFCDDRYLDGMGMVGHARTMLANRMSYCFNFNGPSYNYDSSWTSSIQGLEIAARMVAQGEVEGALIISCNIISFYAQELEYIGMGLLSPDRKTLPFDDKANGFFRSEGVVSIYLQRATDAKRNYCSVLKTQYCPLGDKSCGYVRIDSRLSDMIKDFYNKGQNGDISYVESHVLGNHEADALELNALDDAFTPTTEEPLLVGAISGNVGNCESVNGFVSLAKVIIAMESGVIPPTVNYQTPNSKVPALLDGRIQVVTEPTPLTGDLIGINRFSLTGAVSHVLVKRNCKTGGCQSADSLPRLVLLQARHEDGAQQILNKISSMQMNEEFCTLVNSVFKVPIPSCLWRAYALVSTNGTLTKASQAYDSTVRPVWYVFSGMGSQWAGMGRDLLRIPVFMAAIDRCDQVLRPIGLDIKHIITTDDSTIFNNVLNCFVGIAAIQIGLVDILRALGVTPDGMVGHSVGELACGYADGCLTAEQMILAAYARGKASMDCDSIPGMMAAVGLGYSDIKDHLPPSIDVACHNSSTSCTLSGPTSDVMDYVDKLKQDGVFAKAVSAGGVAYHSRHVKHIGSKLLQYLKKVIPDPRPRSARWVSSSVPQDQWDILDSQLCSAEYHTNNLLSPVLFEEACRHVPENAILIEIAPRGLLQAILRRSMPIGCRNISLTNHTAKSNVNHLLDSIGELFLNNVDVDVNALYPPVSYPVSRGCPSLASLVTWNHDAVLYQEYTSKIKYIIMEGSTETTIDIGFDNTDHRLWSHRKVHGNIVIPFISFLEYTWEFIIKSSRIHLDKSPVVVEDYVFSNPKPLTTAGNDLSISYTPVGLTFELNVGHEIDKRTTIATGKLQRDITGNFMEVSVPKEIHNFEDINQNEFYGVLDRFGVQLGSPLKVVKHVLVGMKKCYSSVEWTGNITVFLGGLLDIVTFLQVDKHQILLNPTSIKKLAANIDFFDSLKQGTKINVLYDFRCDRLVCQGVEMVGVAFTPILPAKTTSVSWSELSLTPLTDKLSLTDFLRSCIQVVANTGLSCWRPDPPPVNILVVKDGEDKHTLFTKHFSRLFSRNIDNNVNIQEVSLEEAQSQVSNETRELYLLAGYLNRIAALEEYLENPNNVYVLANMNENGKKYPGSKYRTIVGNLSDGFNLSLMKIVDLKNDAKVYAIESSDWLNGLRKFVTNEQATSPVIVVSRDKTPTEILPLLAKERYVHRVRSFFILDKDAPRFTVSCQLYRDQLSLGLPVNILSGGTWSSLNIIGLELQSKNTLNIRSDYRKLDIHCVGTNTTHYTLDLAEEEFEEDIKHVDYSGTLNGQRVMGVGRLESYTNKLTPDHTLQWSVPDSWSMEEAATVPVVYTLAYYCMMTKARVKPGETVLVQAGLSPVGQAVIRVALEMGAVVIASVLDDDQAIQLAKAFPQLDSRHIIVLSRQDLKISVKKFTVGRGVEVVVNCLRGKVLQSSVGVMGFDCRFLHLAKITPEDCETVGMLTFLKRTTFQGVSLDSIEDCSEEHKKALRKSLQSGIMRGTVRPFQKIESSSSGFMSMQSIWGGQKKVISLKASVENGLQTERSCSKQTDLAVILGSTKTHLWMDVIEWLNTAGFRKVVMLTENEEGGSSDESDYFRRLNQLIHRNKSEIIVTSSSRLGSLKNACSLVQEVDRLGRITAVVTVDMDELNERLVNLEAASRHLAHPVRQWVSLLGCGEAVSQSRKSAGLSVCCVRTICPLHSPARLLQDLSTVLDVSQPSATFLLVRESTSSADRKEYYDCGALWQLSQKKMATLADLVTERPAFTEEVTRSPGHHLVCRDLLPLFVVPGLGGDRLNSLLQSLIHPAYLSSFPATISTVQEHAALLTQDILRIQNKGKYNILCDMWSSAVALEMCCLLECRGHTVQLFLLEGGPAMAQERMRAFCERHNTDLATGLVAESFNMPPEITRKISQLQGWDDKLSVGLRAGQVPETLKVKLSRSLTSVYHQLTALQLFQATSQLFSGDLTVISHQELSSSDVDSLTQMCQSRPKLEVTHDKSYQDLLNNYTTATFINDNMYFDWTL